MLNENLILVEKKLKTLLNEKYLLNEKNGIYELLFDQVEQVRVQ
jgi:hypothetical protein